MPKSTSPDVVAKNLGLSREVVAKLPTKEVYIIPGKIPPQIPEAYLGAETDIQENQNPHKFSLGRAPMESHPGGWIRRATQKEFPINSTLTSVLQHLEPGAIREMHWHPNADEWQYILSGQSRVTVFGAHGRTRTEECKAGDVVFIQTVFGHYVENTGREPLRFFALFNSPTFEEISISTWLAGNPASLVLRGNVVKRAHVVQPVCELHQKDPNVVGESQQELAKILCGALVLGLGLDLAQLGDPVDEPGDVLAE